MIVFMLCLYLFIHSNYCLSYNYGQESPSETSSEENLADFYGRSDEYLNESGKLWCFCYFICHYIQHFYFSFSFKTCFICKVQRTKTKNGYRQLGLIGNSISTHSYSNCRHFPRNPAFHNCMITNDELNKQNIIQLATEVHQLKKR